MEPLSPRARDALAAYRREHALDPDLHERLVERLATRLALTEPAIEEPAGPPAQPASLSSRLAVWATSGSAALGMLGLLIWLAPTQPPMHTRSASPSPAALAPPASGIVSPAPPSPATARAEEAKSAKSAAIAPTVQKRAGSSRASWQDGQASAGAAPPRAGQAAAHAQGSPSAAPRVSAAEQSREQQAKPPSARARVGGAQPAPEQRPPARAPLPAELDEAERGAEPAAADDGAFAATELGKPREPAKSQGSLDEEVLLLRRAQELSTSGEPLRALAALAEYGRRFPRGKLTEMAEVQRLLASCDLGRVEAARSGALRFLGRYPGSSYAARVRRICAARP